jgi:hypothetical protein
MGALKEKIETFCKDKGIIIPAGFSRHSPSRCTIIRHTDETWQLTAKICFNVSDVINYINNYCEHIEFKILHFKDEVEMKRRGEKQLEKCGSLQDVAKRMQSDAAKPRR